MTLVVDVLAYMALALQVSIAAGLAAYFVQRFNIYDLDSIEYYVKLKTLLRNRYREAAFVVALTATSGSLYMSQILGWEPCLLCWYQRIFMYPLVALFAAALVLDRHDVKPYALITAAIGTPIAFYHVVLHQLDSITSSCSAAVPCGTIHTQHFGYMTTPFLALTGFTAVLLLLWKFSPEEL